MFRAIISGGGTGGHIFPAIAIANALKNQIPGMEILFIGAKGRMEMEKVPAAGYPIEGLWISGLQRKLTLKNLIFPVKVTCSLMKADRIIRKFRPDIVIGVGGFASGPAIRAACWNKIPTLIQEQNSFPGITNKLVAKKVQKICVAYDGMERFFPKEKIIFTGNPVRQDIFSSAEKRESAVDYFSLIKNKKTILVIGGSLGATTINKSIAKCLKSGLFNEDVQFLWQTGKYSYQTVVADKIISGIPGVQIMAFIDRMDLAYAVADIVISRAGAIALSEICIAGKPSILIPSPNVAEDHQTKNARALEAKSAALVLKDSEAEEKLPGQLSALLLNETLQQHLKTNITSLAIPDSAERIAGEAISLIQQKQRDSI